MDTPEVVVEMSHEYSVINSGFLHPHSPETTRGVAERHEGRCHPSPCNYRQDTTCSREVANVRKKHLEPFSQQRPRITVPTGKSKSVRVCVCDTTTSTCSSVTNIDNKMILKFSNDQNHS